MRRALVPVCLVALAATSCGALADDTAATVAGEPVGVTTVEEVTRDDTLAELTQRSVPPSESVLPGDDARSSLLLVMQSVALEQLAEEAGLELDLQDTSALDEQLAQSGFSAKDLGPAARRAIVAQLVGFDALSTWYADLDLSDPEDATDLYDLEPGVWDRRCAVVVSATDDDADAVQDHLDSGGDLVAAPERVEGVELLASGDECRSAAGILATQPPALSGEIVSARPGEVVGPLDVEGSSVWFEVRTDEPGSPETMAEELGDPELRFDPSLLMVWRLLDDSTVNPRFGTGVEIADRLTIGRPAAPEPPSTTVAPAATGQGAP